MTSELDVLRCAKLLFDQYGDEADLIAATRADALLDLGRIDGHAIWVQILRAIVDLRSVTPKPEQPLH